LTAVLLTRIRNLRHAGSAEVFQGRSAQEIRDALEGHVITSFERKGKFFWAVMNAGKSDAVIFHLGMAGSVQVRGHKAPKYVRIKDVDEWPPRFTKVELVFEDETRFAFTDARRCGGPLLMRVAVCDM
jgi:formamidopyrimidine-DNA glycosylase